MKTPRFALTFALALATVTFAGLVAGCGSSHPTAGPATTDSPARPAGAPATATPGLGPGPGAPRHGPHPAPPPRRRRRPTGTTVPPTTVPAPTTTTIGAPAVPAGSTEVAVLNGNTPGSTAPGGPPVQTVPGSWYTAVSTLPVIAQAPGWLEVRLAQRPNESTTWIPASDAKLEVTPDRIVVDLATRHLQLFVDNRLTQDFPAGVGGSGTPTPTGRFFVAFLAAAPSPGYGPFVLVTSAHSDAITDWEQSGDAIVAIHGPIDSAADAAIGTTGADLSNGCVRLHDADLALLRDVPAGTPVDIVSS